MLSCGENCAFKINAAFLLQEVLDVEQIMDEQKGLDLTEDNLESVLDEIRPYLVGGSYPCVYNVDDCGDCGSRNDAASG